MRIYQCANCGTEGIDNSLRQNRKFCCTTCADTYYRRQKGVGIPKDNRQLCQFNDGVECYKKQCRNCGWNPAVARKRLEAVIYG